MVTDTDHDHPQPPDPEPVAQKLDDLAHQMSSFLDVLTSAATEVAALGEPGQRWADEVTAAVSALRSHQKRLRGAGALLRAEHLAASTTPTPADAPASESDAPTDPAFLGAESGDEVPLIHPRYPGMPEGEDWLTNPPPRLHNGRNGFDLRLVRDLAAVGVRAYTLTPLTKFRHMPAAIPVFLDWLKHLDERVPGPEHLGRRNTPEHHKAALRTDLIRNLRDTSAKGNRRAINLLVEQLRRDPPLRDDQRYQAAMSLITVTERSDFYLIAELIREQPRGDDVITALLRYIGRHRTPEARAIALEHFDHPNTRNAVVAALAAMKAPGVRHLIQPLTTDPDPYTRKRATQALDSLPD